MVCDNFGPGLGIDARAFDPDGNVVAGETGELVITQPMPSMPVGLWGDADGSLFRETYFDMYPGVWRHGDWIRFDAVASRDSLADPFALEHIATHASEWTQP